MKMRKSDAEEIQKRIGYRFENIALLQTAFTHSSYANEHECEDNERLEFLGDSILNFVAAKELFSSGKSEGDMTEARKRMVSKEPLALAVERLGLFEFLRMGVGAQKESRLSVKFKSNLFEAVVGAVYLDSGSLETCEKFIDGKLIADIETAKDFKTELQEYIQERKLGKIDYVTQQKSDSKKPEFVSVAKLAGDNIGQGYGYSKKDAEKAAAKKALEFLKSNTVK